MDRQSVITSSKRKQVNLDRTFSKKNLVEVPSDEEEIEILDRNSANVLNRTFNPNNKTISTTPPKKSLVSQDLDRTFDPATATFSPEIKTNTNSSQKTKLTKKVSKSKLSNIASFFQPCPKPSSSVLVLL